MTGSDQKRRSLDESGLPPRGRAPPQCCVAITSNSALAPSCSPRPPSLRCRGRRAPCRSPEQPRQSGSCRNAAPRGRWAPSSSRRRPTWPPRPCRARPHARVVPRAANVPHVMHRRRADAVLLGPLDRHRHRPLDVHPEAAVCVDPRYGIALAFDLQFGPGVQTTGLVSGDIGAFETPCVSTPRRSLSMRTSEDSTTSSSRRAWLQNTCSVASRFNSTST